jgi:hypothetical protein
LPLAQAHGYAHKPGRHGFLLAGYTLFQIHDVTILGLQHAF